jgi:hypothetical protein
MTWGSSALASVLAAAQYVRGRATFRGSADYWERRYARGGNSGDGSYGEVANFKAQALNHFVSQAGVGSVIEFGCGDGNQLALSTYPRYIGLDVSPTVVRLCADRFADDPSKSFYCYDPQAFFDRGRIFRADLSLSLDVLFHLVEQDQFEAYLRHLFNAGDRFVGIFAQDRDVPSPSPHVTDRAFTPWIRQNCPEWELMQVVENPHKEHENTGADFYFYERRT